MSAYFITMFRALYYFGALVLLAAAAFFPVFVFLPWYGSLIFYWVVFTLIYLDLKAPAWGPTAIFRGGGE